MGNPLQGYGASPAVWVHTLLPATRHRLMQPDRPELNLHTPEELKAKT